MYLPDYNDLADRHDREEEEWLESRPKCAYCGEPIQDELCYVINDEIICRDCLEENFEKNTSTLACWA